MLMSFDALTTNLSLNLLQSLLHGHNNIMLTTIRQSDRFGEDNHHGHPREEPPSRPVHHNHHGHPREDLPARPIHAHRHDDHLLHERHQGRAMEIAEETWAMVAMEAARLQRQRKREDPPAWPIHAHGHEDHLLHELHEGRIMEISRSQRRLGPWRRWRLLGYREKLFEVWISFTIWWNTWKVFFT